MVATCLVPSPLARRTDIGLASVDVLAADSLEVQHRQLPRFCAARLHHNAR